MMQEMGEKERNSGNIDTDIIMQSSMSYRQERKSNFFYTIDTNFIQTRVKYLIVLTEGSHHAINLGEESLAHPHLNLARQI